MTREDLQRHMVEMHKCAPESVKGRTTLDLVLTHQADHMDLDTIIRRKGASNHRHSDFTQVDSIPLDIDPEDIDPEEIDPA